jgi:hypothetical protein
MVGMPKTVLLHIGTAKTGTSSIQKWLARAQQHGKLVPVGYPLWGGECDHERLVVLYKSYEDLPPPRRQSYGPGGRSYTRMRERYREFLFDELRAASGAVISAESLCDFSPLLAAKLREDFESLGFREFHVVLYVRDPAELFLSSTQQRLKRTVAPPFVRDPASFKYNFLQMAETWEQAFPGRLIVRKFFSGASQNVIEDFSSLLEQYLGVTLPAVSLRENTSLSAEGMQILQDYRETFWPDNGGIQTPDVARLVRFLAERTRDIPQTKAVLKPELAELIRANHKADAEALYAHYGVNLGLRNCPPTAGLPRESPYCVNEIVESVDPQILRQLLLRLAHAGLDRSRVIDVAARSYRRIPPAHRPERLANWLRSRL